MDLTSILNNSDDRDQRSSGSPASAAPSHQPRRPPPPPLSTPRSSSNLGAYPLSAAPAYDRQNSAVAQSPARSFSASSHTPTPHSSAQPSFPSPYPRHAPLPSPVQKQSTPSSYFAPTQRPLSNHGGGRPSSSPYDHPASYQSIQSPTVGRHNSYQHTAASPVQPQTPLAPPPLPRAESSSLSTKDATFGLVHHRSPSGASLASPYRPPLQNSRSYSYNTVDQPPPHINGSPDQSRRRSSGHSYSSQRHQSVSVSPKTVIQNLPQQQQQVHPRQPHSDSNNVPAHPQVLHAHSDPHYSYAPPTIVHSRSSTTPKMQPLQPAAEINKAPSTEPTSAESQPQAPASTPAPAPTTSTKRKAQSDATPSAPVKRPRRIKEPPIWAQKKRDQRSMGPRGHANGDTKSKPVQAVPNAAVTVSEFEPSMTNIIPSESLLRQVTLFLFHHVVEGPPDAPFEIEAKIGTLCDQNTSQRIQLPVLSEVILDESLPLKFESLMDESHHKAMNGFLNSLVADSARRNPDRTWRSIAYKHKREIDELFELTGEGQMMLSEQLRERLQTNAHRFKPKVRVTRDQQSGKVLNKIVKSRVADMNIYCPGAPFDYRISINLEQEWDGDMSTLKPSGDQERIKDRLSYTHQWCQVDLTQVKTGASSRKVHELEVELDVKRLRDEGREALAGNQKNMMEDVIRVFLDNVRTLVRYAPPIGPA